MAAAAALHADRGDDRTRNTDDQPADSGNLPTGELTDGHLKPHPNLHSLTDVARSTPGTIAATSQLAWLISMTAMIVLSCTRALRDRLKSWHWGMGRSFGWLRRR